MSAYGFVLQSENMKERKTRFRKDDKTGFIDIWHGKKGMTIGIYNQKTHSMGYVRNGNVNKLETVLINYSKV